MANKIPRDKDNDYTREMASRRCDFVSDRTGAALDHLRSYSFDPAVLPGNIEHFSGVAQVPIGFAGPLLVNGEHAQGEFFVPLATTEGTLVEFDCAVACPRALGSWLPGGWQLTWRC